MPVPKPVGEKSVVYVKADFPDVRDASESGSDQVLIDPTGDPNTAAHSVPGPNGGSALSFDGLDDRIDFGAALLGDAVAAGRDFTIALRVRVESDPGAAAKTFFRRSGQADQPYMKLSVSQGRFFWRVCWGPGYVDITSAAAMLDGAWRHVVCRRQGQSLSIWVDGFPQETRTHADYARTLFSNTWQPAAIGQVYQSPASDWPFEMADFQVWRRALSDGEVAAL